MKRRPLWHGLRGGWWVPVLLTAAATGAAVLYTIRAPAYQATSSVLAHEPTNANGQSLNFPDVATSNTVAAMAIHDSKVTGLTPEQLVSRTSVTSTRSNIYRITVGFATAVGATRLANAVAVDAARMYEKLAAAEPAPIIGDLSQRLTDFRNQYLAATQALTAFEAAHPEVRPETAQQAANPPPRPTPSASPAPTPPFTASIEAQEQQLQLDQQAAHDAYLNMQNAIATAGVDQATANRNFAAVPLDTAVAESLAKSTWWKILLAGGLGLVVGLLLVLTGEYMRTPAVVVTAPTPPAVPPRVRDETERLVGVSPHAGNGPRA